jgi:hypothetical protein
MAAGWQRDSTGVINTLELPRSGAPAAIPPDMISTTVWSASPAGQVGTGVQSFSDASIPARIQCSTATQPVTPGASPSVVEIYPTSGPVAGGTALTIAGSGFTGATAVTIGGTAATGRSVVNDGCITCTSPAHTAGAANVAVTTPEGTNTLTGAFTYQ